MADSSALPKPGDTVAAKYLIERTIGTGGMSVVFGATHRVTGKRFAIKWLLRDDNTPGAEATARFIREAQVAGRFQHPNVVEIYDIGEINGSFYMVMDWLEGESLATRLERGRLSLDEACRHLIPCMRGMDDAHAAGIVHRDLKPANIFLCQATKHNPERPKVLDFGVAKLLDPTNQMAASLVTKAGMLIGTPYYLSPEQLRGLPVDARTDVYAFGVILYQVLSGELPFPATTFGELVMQIAAGAPLPLRHLVPTLPVGVDELVARAMMRDPGQRFQNLHGLISALEHFTPGRTSQSMHRDELVIVSDTRSSTPPPVLNDSGMTPAPIVSEIDEPSPAKRSAWMVVTLVVIAFSSVLLARQFSQQNDRTGIEPGASASATTASVPAQAKASDPAPETSRSAATQPAASPTKQSPSAAPAAAPDAGSAATPGGGEASGSAPAAPVPNDLDARPAPPRPSTQSADVPGQQPAAKPRPRMAAPVPPSQPLHVEPPPSPAAPAAAPAASERNPLDMRLQ